MNGSLTITRKKDQWLKIGEAWVQVIRCGASSSTLRIVANRTTTRIVRAEISGEEPPGPSAAYLESHPLQLSQ